MTNLDSFRTSDAVGEARVTPERATFIKYLDSQCHLVRDPRSASYEDTSSFSGSMLRFMNSIIDDLIIPHLQRDDVVPIGYGSPNDLRVVGDWSLTFNENARGWRGSRGNVDVLARFDTDVTDLTKLLRAFDRLSENTSAMDQTRRVVMEVGYDETQEPWACASANESKISWKTDLGLIPVVAVDSPELISNLDRVICHEITHLMEPELSEPLEALTQVLINDRFVADGSDSISFSANHKEILTAINPDYFPLQIKTWELQMTAMEEARRSMSIPLSLYNDLVHKQSEMLAAEIISETACDRFWHLPSHPKSPKQWAELNQAIFFTLASMDVSTKSDAKVRVTFYDYPQMKEPFPKGIYVSPIPQPLPRGFLSVTHHLPPSKQRYW